MKSKGRNHTRWHLGILTSKGRYFGMLDFLRRLNSKCLPAFQRGSPSGIVISCRQGCRRYTVHQRSTRHTLMPIHVKMSLYFISCSLWCLLLSEIIIFLWDYSPKERNKKVARDHGKLIHKNFIKTNAT